MVSPDSGSRSNNSRCDSVSSQEIEEGKGEGTDPSERPDSRVSSYSRGSRESTTSKTAQRGEKSSSRKDPLSFSSKKIFTDYHTQRRPSNSSGGFRNVGGKDTRKRRASSPDPSHSPLAKKSRDERSSIDQQKGNIFSRLGSYQRSSKDHRVIAASESPSPRSCRTRSHGQDSSQASSERSQSPASQHCSSSPARSSSRGGHRERGDKKKRGGSSPSPTRSRSGRRRSRSEKSKSREREDSGERKRSECRSRSRRKESERESSRRRARKVDEEEEEEEEEGRRRGVSSSKRRRKSQSDRDSDSEREGDKSSYWRVKNAMEKRGGAGRGAGKVETAEREICNISWDEAETTADEMETLAGGEKSEGMSESAVATGAQSPVEVEAPVEVEEERKEKDEGEVEVKDATSQPLLAADKDITETAEEEKKEEEEVKEEEEGDGKKEEGENKDPNKQKSPPSEIKIAEKEEKKTSEDGGSISSGPVKTKEKEKEKRRNSGRSEASPPKSQRKSKKERETNVHVPPAPERAKGVEVGGAASQPAAAKTAAEENKKLEPVSKVDSGVEDKSDVEKVRDREKTPPTTAPPTSRDYTDRDVTPPLEVLQSMQTPFQQQFFSIPFPCTSPVPLTAFHPAHLFAGQPPPVGGASIPTPALSFPATLPAAGGIVTSAGVWPLHMAPASWQQIWLNQQPLVAGAAPGNDTGSHAKPEPQPAVIATQTAQTVEPTVHPSTPNDKTPRPQRSVETETTRQENNKTVSVPTPKATDNLPVTRHSSTSSTSIPETVAHGTQTVHSKEVPASADAECHLSKPPSPSSKISQQVVVEEEEERRRCEVVKGKRKMDAKCRQQYREMMEKFKRHASLLAVSTKMMIRYI